MDVNLPSVASAVGLSSILNPKFFRICCASGYSLIVSFTGFEKSIILLKKNLLCFLPLFYGKSKRMSVVKTTKFRKISGFNIKIETINYL